MANIQTKNPYEQMNPDFDGEDVQCTKENPCGECDYCTEKPEGVCAVAWGSEGECPQCETEEDELEYIQQMADRFGGGTNEV